MLPARNRLKRTDIISLLTNGVRKPIGELLFIYKKTTESPWRVAIIVPKRISKKAVVRNRLKRQLATAFLHLKETSGSSMDLLCKVVKPTKKSIRELQQDIDTFIKLTS